MIELDGFVKRASNLLRDSVLPDAPNARTFLTDFTDTFTFLGTEEYQTACSGIADSWMYYLRNNPGSVINVLGMQYDTFGKPHPPKSNNQVPKDVIGYIDAASRNRVLSTPEDWQEGEHAKLVALDDWKVGGETLEIMASQAYTFAQRLGKTNLKYICLLVPPIR